MKVDGKYSLANIAGFAFFCCNYFMIQNMAFMCVHEANKANLNPGVITAMWSITPLWMALTDWLVFSIRLKYHHYIGMTCMIICTLVLALSDLMKGKDQTKQ